MALVSQVMHQVATEAIDYQYNAVLFNDIATKISEIRNMAGEGKLTNKIMNNSGISKIINRHTRLNLELECQQASYENAWVFIPDINRNNPILGPNLGYWQNEKELKGATREKGFIDAQVDLAKGQVGGYYSHLPTTAVVTSGLVIGKNNDGTYRYTSEEVSAIILHEIGHLFSFLESMAQVFVRNWMIQSRVKDYINCGDNKVEKLRIVTDMKKAGILDEDINTDTLVDGGDKGLCLIITRSYKKVYQDAAVRFHDNTAFESAADQFAVRMGAGRHLASALVKLGDNMGKFSYYLGVFLNILWLGFTVVGTALGYINPFVGGFMVLLFVGIGFGENSFVYDTTIDRLTRIREEMITPLKKSNLPEEMKKSLLKQYDELEEACKKSPFYKEYPDHKGFFGWVTSYLIPSLNKNRKSKEYQQLIESLQNNELYAAAARF